jgi:hypothetical protein
MLVHLSKLLIDILLNKKFYLCTKATGLIIVVEFNPLTIAQKIKLYYLAAISFLFYKPKARLSSIATIWLVRFASGSFFSLDPYFPPDLDLETLKRLISKPILKSRYSQTSLLLRLKFLERVKKTRI